MRVLAYTSEITLRSRLKVSSVSSKFADEVVFGAEAFLY